MEKVIAINCPVSTDRVNENVVRIAAFFVIAVTFISVWFDSYLPMLFLAADFALRAFTSGKISPIKILSKKIVATLNTKEKFVDAAPKKFAAGVGMVFCLGIALLQIFECYTAANLVAAMLLVCALLEGGAAICVGCIVYTFAVLPFTTRK